MNNDRRLTALITGASSGIGLEIAKILRAKGCNLILVSRSGERLEEARKALPDGTGSIAIIPCDLSQKSAARDLYKHCHEKNLAIDILVNNAGFGLLGEHVEFEAERVEDMILLNVGSLTTLCCLFGKDMKDRRMGYILNVGSTAAYQPIPFFAAYSASKDYVCSFSQALSKELEDHNISVSCLNPGPTATEFFSVAGVNEEMHEGFFGLKTRMSAQDVAQAGVAGMFARRRVIIPGLRNRLLAFWGFYLPRPLVLWGLKQILRKEIKR